MLATHQQISINKIRQHISDGFMSHDSLKESFNLLLSTVTPAHFPYYRDSIAMLLSDIKRFNDDSRLETFYQADLDVRRNRLKQRVLSTTSALEKFFADNMIYTVSIVDENGSGTTVNNSTNVVTGDIITSGSVFIGDRQVPNYLNQTPKQVGVKPTTKLTKTWTDFQIFINSLRQAYQIAVSLENTDLIAKGKNLIKECQSDLEVYCDTPDDPGYNFYDSCKKIADYYKEVDESKELFDKEWRVTIKNTLGSGQDYVAIMKCIEILEQNVPPKALTELVELKTTLTSTSPVRLRVMVKELILEIVNS